MKTPSIKLLLLWNVSLTMLVLLLLGLYATAAQAANDPPLRAFYATSDHGSSGKGVGNTRPIQVTSRTSWTLLQKLTVNLSGNHNHECAVMASSNVFNTPGNSEDNKYEFVLTLDDPNPSETLATTRFLDFDNERTVSDQIDTEVTSTALYHATNEPHTFYWLARKVSPNASPPSVMTVARTTMWVLCVKNLQP